MGRELQEPEADTAIFWLGVGIEFGVMEPYGIKALYVVLSFNLGHHLDPNYKKVYPQCRFKIRINIWFKFPAKI